jgi:hypothetical protein
MNVKCRHRFMTIVIISEREAPSVQSLDCCRPLRLPPRFYPCWYRNICANDALIHRWKYRRDFQQLYYETVSA